MNEAQLMREFTARAKACGLQVDCLGAGGIGSEIVIIGEAPTEQDNAMKMPMVGGQGKLLWNILRKYNITRKDCYVTNVVKQQVNLSSKVDAKSPIKKIELEHWEGILDWELDQLPNVKYILALGNYALHALTGDTGITKWRGSVFDCAVGKTRRVVKVICTNNPGHIMRNLDMEPMYRLDLSKLQRVRDGSFTTHKVNAIINPSYEDAIRYLDKIEKDGIPIAFDIEVIANETACIGFANNAYEGFCINFRDDSSNRYTLSEELFLRNKIQELFHNPKNKFIAQNGSFDCGWLWYKDRIHVPTLWFDTLLAHHTLYPRLPHNLGYLTAQYTDHPYYKDEGKTWREGGNINQFWDYNVKDCCITWACHAAMLKELGNQGLKDFYFNHVQRLQHHLVLMQVGGVLADASLKSAIAESLCIDLDIRLKEIQDYTIELTGDPAFVINPNSHKQLGILFFSYLGLVGRGATTGVENRQRMKDNPKTSPEARKLIEMIDVYVKEHKFYGTYATMQVDPDGRIRCEYKQYGVQSAPGRLSSSKTLWGSGMNLQNQPKRAYPMFIADKGYMLSYFDLKQAEAKVVAHLWNVRGLIENFHLAETQDGYDVHRLNAASIFKCDYNEIPSDDRDESGEPTKRFLGKRCVHGLNYRMQAPKLAEVCSIPMQQAYEAYASYHRAFPEIQRGWSDTIKEVRDNKMLFSPFGRRMIWLERLDEESFDSVIAFKPQSTIGDKVSSVIYLCHDDPDWPTDARVLLNVHDALIAIHRPEDKERVQMVMRRHAEAPIMIRGEPVVIFTDFKESVPDEKGIHRWSTLKEV
jgi:uracil-DNA glycosylase family 4